MAKKETIQELLERLKREARKEIREGKESFIYIAESAGKSWEEVTSLAEDVSTIISALDATGFQDLVAESRIELANAFNTGRNNDYESAVDFFAGMITNEVEIPYYFGTGYQNPKELAWILLYYADTSRYWDLRSQAKAMRK